MKGKTKPRILCVDDEQAVVDGLRLHLRKGYIVTTATSGAEALELLDPKRPFAVIMSDMRMPGMDGATFLAAARDRAPDSIRMLLTGFSDMEAAIKAINEGGIFRFLTKPCPPAMLKKAFEDGVELFRLRTAEKELLEETLHGSIKALTEVLGLVNPAAFGRATRVKRHVADIAAALKLEPRWQLEVAAMLSQVATVTLPPATVERLHACSELSEREQEMVERLPSVTKHLIGHIPRMGPIQAILAQQVNRFDGRDTNPHGKKADPPVEGARALKIALDYDELECQGLTSPIALDSMRSTYGVYDPDMLETFAALRGNAIQRAEVRELTLKELKVGMVFAEDVQTRQGALMVARGYEVTGGLLERLRNLPGDYVAEPIRVVVRRLDKD